MSGRRTTELLGRRRRRPRGVRASLAERDRALFTRVAGAEAPWLDRSLPRLSRAADHGALWIGVAALLHLVGGPPGRRAAVRGVGSMAATSLLVNAVVKRAVRRPRPSLRGVPVVRRLRVVPLTTSFPSGHAASAAAFATGASAELPAAAPVLAAAAAAVGVSRVYVGVHYPLDVLAGAAIGMSVARLGCRVRRAGGSRARPDLERLVAVRSRLASAPAGDPRHVA